MSDERTYDSPEVWSAYWLGGGLGALALFEDRADGLLAVFALGGPSAFVACLEVGEAVRCPNCEGTGNRPERRGNRFTSTCTMCHGFCGVRRIAAGSVGDRWIRAIEVYSWHSLP